MTPREGLASFDFSFELGMSDMGPACNDNTWKLPLVAKRCRVLLERSKFSKEITCYRSKNDCLKKNQDCVLIRDKVQTHHASSKNGKSLHKI
jgi:hypothetical protein